MGAWLYVSVGDSMSLDDYTGVEGAGAASMLFRNCAELWSDFEGRDLASTFTGATHLVLSTNGIAPETILRDQVGDVPANANLVTVTAGSRQLLSSLDRFMPGFVEKDLMRAAAENIVERLDAIVAGVRERAPEALILVNNIIDPADSRGKLRGWLEWPGLTRYLAKVNKGIVALAKAHGAGLVDVHRPFRGHGMTSASEKRWLASITEVNAAGAHEIRRLWWEQLKQRGLV